MSNLENKRIVLGVTGSIACYKAVDLASKLTQAGALVDVILTPSAFQFITPLTFQSVTGRRAYTDQDLWGNQGHVVHVGLGQAAEILVIAPATANTIAKLAHGIGDTLLTLTALAARCPLLVAPAMDGGMYEHPATQSNLETLRQRAVLFAGPETGRLASGLSGVGRLIEPLELVGHIRKALGRTGALAGRHIVITAGGTQEAIDPVRVVTNRSSGKQGYAIAQAAIDLGAEVTLISAPADLHSPVGAYRIVVSSASEMLAQVLQATHNADVLIMAAAVADFKPVSSAQQKIKKSAGLSEIKLEPTTDILKKVAQAKPGRTHPLLTVGFAAESQDLLKNAEAKLRDKQLDMIVANDISAADAGFGADTNRVTLLYPDGRSEPLPLLSKDRVAETILERVILMLQQRVD